MTDLAAGELNGPKWVTFKTDGKGSISEFREGVAIHHGADRGLWPPYVQPVFEHMYSEGWPLTTPWAWIVKVEDLERYLATACTASSSKKTLKRIDEEGGSEAQIAQNHCQSRCDQILVIHD